MDKWNLDETPLSKWQYLQHYKSITPKILYEERQILLGVHVDLVTLHDRFTFSIELDK